MIESFFLQQHRFPSITETAQSIRHARSTVHSYLHEMDKRGILVYDGKEKRIETDKMRKVDAETVFTPILGAVPCGTPQIEEENIEEYLPLPAAVRCRRIRILYELFSAPKQQINFFFSSSAVAVSRGGIPTDNAAMEAINGWVKAELFTDFHVTDNNKIKQEIAEYITFFYEQRPAYSLNYRHRSNSESHIL